MLWQKRPNAMAKETCFPGHLQAISHIPRVFYWVLPAAPCVSSAASSVLKFSQADEAGPRKINSTSPDNVNVVIVAPAFLLGHFCGIAVIAMA